MYSFICSGCRYCWIAKLQCHVWYYEVHLGAREWNLRAIWVAGAILRDPLFSVVRYARPWRWKIHSNESLKSTRRLQKICRQLPWTFRWISLSFSEKYKANKNTCSSNGDFHMFHLMGKGSINHLQQIQGVDRICCVFFPFNRGH